MHLTSKQIVLESPGWSVFEANIRKATKTDQPGVRDLLARFVLKLCTYENDSSKFVVGKKRNKARKSRLVRFCSKLKT